METPIQETELYKKFKKALNIVDMQAGDNPFVVDCCKIAEEYANDFHSKFRPSDEEIEDLLDEEGHDPDTFPFKVKGAKYLRDKIFKAEK